MKIVRRLSKAVKLPIGRHIVVTKITNKGVYARNIGEHSEYWLAENLDNFIDISNKSCQVSRVELNALKHAVLVHHSLTDAHNKEWKAIIDNKPEIIKFWNSKEGVIYIWPDLIKQRVINGKPYAYIEIKMRCYEKPSKKRLTTTRILVRSIINSSNIVSTKLLYERRCLTMKPGQLANVDGRLVRCKKRIYGCKECVFDDMLMCPRAGKDNKNKPSCIEDGVIFVKP